jgi:hypothetical protein
VQYKVHGVPKPAPTSGLLSSLTPQLPSSKGLEAHIAQKSHDTQVYRMSKAASARLPVFPKHPSGSTPYEVNPLSTFKGQSPALHAPKPFGHIHR